jgi:hypothetical protein
MKRYYHPLFHSGIRITGHVRRRPNGRVEPFKPISPSAAGDGFAILQICIVPEPDSGRPAPSHRRNRSAMVGDRDRRPAGGNLGSMQRLMPAILGEQIF